MKKSIFSVLLTVFAVLGLQAQGVLGKWKTIDDKTGKPKSVVEITEQNGKIYGTVIEILSEKKDAKCTKCKGENKDKPVKGMQVVLGLSKDGDEYSGGKILDPVSGKEYKCIIKLNGKDKLDVRGYIGFSLIGRTQTWHRI